MKHLITIFLFFIASVSYGQNVHNVPSGKPHPGNSSEHYRNIVNVADYGAIGDMVSGTNGSYTGTTTFTGSGFTAADVGKTIRIQIAAGDLITTISGFTNSTTITLANSTTGTRSSQTYDYGTNNTAAIQAAANAIPTTGGVLYFPYGYYLKNGLVNIPNPTYVLGNTRTGIASYDSNVSNTLRPHSTIYEISANLPQSVTIQSIGSTWEGVDLYLNSSATITSGVGLNINASDVSLINSQFGGFWIAASQNYSGYWRGEHCAFAGLQYGLVVRNISNGDAGDYSIVDCWFGGYGSHPASTMLLLQSSGGIKIVNSKWNVGFHKAISIEITAPAASTTDFQLSNCSIENFDSTAVNIVANNGASFGNIVINNNQISPFGVHATAIRINGTGAAFPYLRGVSISGNIIYNQSSGDTAIIATAVNDLSIIGNIIDGSWVRKVYINPNCTGVFGVVQDYLQIPKSDKAVNSTVPQISSNFSDLAGYSQFLMQPSGAGNNGMSLYLMPTGTGYSSGTMNSEINLFNTNFIADGTNFEFLQIRAAGTAGYNFISSKGGTGTLRPITFSASTSNEQLKLFTSGSVVANVGMNMASDQSTGQLQIKTALQAQLALHYDNTHYTAFTTNSTSGLDIRGLSGLTFPTAAFPTGTTTDSVLVETTSAGVATIKKVAQSSLGGGGGGSLTATFVGYGDGSNLLTGTSDLTYATSTGTFSLTKALSAGVGISISNSTSNAAASVFNRVTSTKLTQMLQYSPTTTAYGGYVANAGGIYTTSQNLVLMADLASSELDVAVGGTTPSTLYKFTGSSVSPTTTVTYDLGTSSLAWRDVYLSHTVGESAIGVSSALGTNVSSLTPSGNDMDFKLTLVTSSSISGSTGNIAFGRTWGATPKCVISAADATTGSAVALSTGGYVSLNAISASAMTMTAIITASGTYVFNCHCGQ